MFDCFSTNAFLKIPPPHHNRVSHAGSNSKSSLPLLHERIAGDWLGTGHVSRKVKEGRGRARRFPKRERAESETSDRKMPRRRRPRRGAPLWEEAVQGPSASG